jgi:hypothetical protein
MVALHFSVTIGEDRRLVIDLPPEVPVVPAEVTLQAELSPLPTRTTHITREAIMAALRESGLLAEPDEMGIEDDPDIYTDEELATVVTLMPGARPSHELVDEDRGPR